MFSVQVRPQRAHRQFRIEDLIPRNVLRLLQLFSSHANRFTGCAHPNDREQRDEGRVTLLEPFLAGLALAQSFGVN